MKAPDKIYICPSELAGIDYEEEWLDRPFGDSIEYTRTDAFIEKALEFFDDHLWEYIDVENANCDTFVNINGDKFKEDFKKYIEK